MLSEMNVQASPQLNPLIPLSLAAGKGYPKHALPCFLFISLFHMGYLPPLSSAGVVTQMEMQPAGSRPYPWWKLTGFGRVALLIEALPKLQQHPLL